MPKKFSGEPENQEFSGTPKKHLTKIGAFMFATIRIRARLFKAAKKLLQQVKTKVEKSKRQLAIKAKKLKSTWITFWSYFKTKRNCSDPLILIALKIEKKESKQTTGPNNPSKPDLGLHNEAEAHSSKHHDSSLCHREAITRFYKEWEAASGPALTSIDRSFLENAKPHIAEQVMKNGRLTLKSPYLKAVYNGLKDLEQISDLLTHDKNARERIYPIFKDSYDKGPEVFYMLVTASHDKGVFPTRSGERRLNLDPRLIPAWLGLEA